MSLSPFSSAMDLARAIRERRPSPVELPVTRATRPASIGSSRSSLQVSCTPSMYSSAKT